ncbi:unnamed protein product, partial [Ectocarpus fasciculatus]
MVRDAEEHAEADKKRRDLIEAKNSADSAVYGTEKNLLEHKDKIPEEVKADVQKAIDELKAVMESEDAEQIKEKVQALQTAALKIGEAIYGNKGAAGDDAE